MKSVCGLSAGETALDIVYWKKPTISKPGQSGLQLSDAMLVASDLQHNTSIQELRIHVQGVQDREETLSKIFAALPLSSSLTSLDMSIMGGTWMPYGSTLLMDKAVVDLLVAAMPKLKSFAARNISLQRRVFLAITTAAYRSPKLVSLDLSATQWLY